MTIGYFRKSNYGLDETIKKTRGVIQKLDWKITGETELPNGQGQIISLCDQGLLKAAMKQDDNILSLLPCSISIFKRQNDVIIGSGQTSLIKMISQDPIITNEANLMEEKIKEIIHAAAGVSALKRKTVKLYSTLSCPYCKMEKSWLEEKKISHQVIYVDQNRAAAEEMVKKTGQMGVPVTEIEFDDADPQFVIGFDRPKLMGLLDIKS